MMSPWGEVTFSYGMGEYRSTNEFPSNNKYKNFIHLMLSL